MNTEKQIKHSYGILAYTRTPELKFLLGERSHTYAFSDLTMKHFRKDDARLLAKDLTLDEQSLIMNDPRYKRLSETIKGVRVKGDVIWAPVRGRQNYEESEMDCAYREFREETKMDAQDMKILDISLEEEIETENNLFVCIYFLAESDGDFLPRKKRRLGKELRRVKWLTYDEAMKVLHNRETTQDILREAKNIIEEN
jgi:ADP-ribose pyrophosphatase YjhB (NUDIX family)